MKKNIIASMILFFCIQVNPQDYSDSSEIVKLREQVTKMQQYLEDIESLRILKITDSIKQKQQKASIDSLRKTTEGVPLIINNDTLLRFFCALGGISITDRIENTKKIIMELGKTRSVCPDSIYLLPVKEGYQIEIMYQNRLIKSVSKDDALWMDIPFQTLAIMERNAIVNAITDIQKKNNWLQLIKRIFLFILVLAIQYFLIRLTNWLYRKFKLIINKNAEIKFKPIVIRDYEILNTAKQTKIIIFSGNILRLFLFLVQGLISVPILFSIFPATKDFANKLWGYIFTPAKNIFISIVEYIPQLFIIVIIWLSIRYLVKGIKYLAKEISEGRLKITGFYADWAMPSFHIIKFLLYAFMIAMMYQYLPGSNTSAFQGVSIFVGLIVSLGSTTVVANIMAGLVITYMRPFKVGDRIKLNDTIGNVMEKSAFVTRIKTPKNEIVTIPNSLIMTAHTINYSASARDFGLIIHSNITIGYDVPWQKAHELLIRAAKETDGVIKDREPFVFNLDMENYCNSYQINVYISDADMMPKILTKLHSKIQDVFLQEGIDIETPMLVSEKN